MGKSVSEQARKLQDAQAEKLTSLQANKLTRLTLAKIAKSDKSGQKLTKVKKCS